MYEGLVLFCSFPPLNLHPQERSRASSDLLPQTPILFIYYYYYTAFMILRGVSLSPFSFTIFTISAHGWPKSQFPSIFLGVITNNPMIGMEHMDKLRTKIKSQWFGVD